MVNCYICDKHFAPHSREARQLLRPHLGDGINARRRELAPLHRARFPLEAEEIEDITKICLNCDLRLSK